MNHSLIENYGALDILLDCDNPAFVDPFLIFANSKYKRLHMFIIRYLKFLVNLSAREGAVNLETGVFKNYYKFKEVKEVWLGYSKSGNTGLGLSYGFADSLHMNLNNVFSNFGEETITESHHLEKLCLIEEGVGIDKISDFTLNLIKGFLCEYTEEFSRKNIDSKLLFCFPVQKIQFDFKRELWKDRRFTLPFVEKNGKKEFVLLIPKDILVKKRTWISKDDFLSSDQSIFDAIDNDAMRDKINRFYLGKLASIIDKKGKVKKDYRKRSKVNALKKTLQEYPIVVDLYIKRKEGEKNLALKGNQNDIKIIDSQSIAVVMKKEIQKKDFKPAIVLEDVLKRVAFYKELLESNSGSVYFSRKGLTERNLQIVFKATTMESLFSYDAEVNNGRGPIDFIASYGSDKKVGIELKMAKNFNKNSFNQHKHIPEGF